ncbi:hypothetical protein [Pleomorphomonas oryzae]|uniref:hypothetical protein n=1 Tax=Pleomorphomonas oryzae TaxID=261934 RepID=UPI0004289D8A|nr:hypothetical protein [Pleomorphomonas oryzae]
MNSNLFHNIANVLTAILAVLVAVLLFTGCTGDFTTQSIVDCSGSSIDAKWLSIAIAVVSALKLGVNVLRDGMSGLTKPQPPVEK